MYVILNLALSGNNSITVKIMLTEQHCIAIELQHFEVIPRISVSKAFVGLACCFTVAEQQQRLVRKIVK